MFLSVWSLAIQNRKACSSDDFGIVDGLGRGQTEQKSNESDSENSSAEQFSLYYRDPTPQQRA